MAHFTSPQFYDGLIPPFLPAPRAWIYASGVAELACAAAVAVPRTRRMGGLATAALLVAVLPGNLWMVVEPGGVPRWAAVARLPAAGAAGAVGPSGRPRRCGGRRAGTGREG
jgi:uncharacterized membrane protein